MRSFSVAASALALATAVLAVPSPAQNLEARATSASSSSLPTVTVKGNAFYAGDERFFIRGVDYQPGGSSKATDPMADSTTCTRDIAKFKDLGINTVRVYTVDNTATHDDCMSMLAAAGIYLVLDVNTPKYSLNRADPAASYNDVYLQSIFATIDAFANYTNVLAFFSGNEVINDDTTTDAAPYVKAVTRDMRQYIKSRGYRSIPVGYSAADVSANRMEMAHYMNCGTDDERSDFFAFNDYSWCDPSSFTTSGWDQKVKNFTDYGIPIFLSEYGCVAGKYRHFEETAALYNTEMTSVYSGGLVYEYSEEDSGYGLVTIKDTSSVTEGDDYPFLKSILAANPAPTDAAGASTTQTSSTCPTADANWNVTGSALPAIPDKAAKYMSSGAGKGPGLTGDGSQNAGGTSTGTAAPGSGSVTAVASGGSSSSTSSSGSASTSSAAKPGPQPFDQMPMVVGAVIIGFTMLGMTLL